MPIGLEYRDSKAVGVSQRRRSVYNAVRGRPWNPCDWRGLGALLPDKVRGDGWFEGPRQWLRLLRIRHFGGADYRCEEVNAAGAVSPVRAFAIPSHERMTARTPNAVAELLPPLLS